MFSEVCCPSPYIRRIHVKAPHLDLLHCLQIFQQKYPDVELTTRIIGMLGVAL
jgi:hypothetical protein